MAAFYLSPLWVVGAIVVILSRSRQKERHVPADTSALILVICLIGLYFLLVFLMD